MDPNEALRQLRLLVKQMRLEDKTPIRESAELFNFVQHARDLAETVEGLDEWLGRDGFLPDDWRSDDAKSTGRNNDHPPSRTTLAAFLSKEAGLTEPEQANTVAGHLTQAFTITWKD